MAWLGYTLAGYIDIQHEVAIPDRQCDLVRISYVGVFCACGGVSEFEAGLVPITAVTCAMGMTVLKVCLHTVMERGNGIFD